ncbi:Mitochondrial K+-H+ exchange-related domain containing protein [Tylopilus felleus]
MNILSKGAHSMRIIALPIARVRMSPDAKPKPSNSNVNTLLVYYHFDLVSPYGARNDLSWHKKALKGVVDKAADMWSNLGKAQKGSWKLWTYELGERMTDRIEFEELALRNVDPSLGPTVPVTGMSKEQEDVKKARSQLYSLPKIPLIYPPSLYPAGTDPALNPSLAHLQTLLASRGPRHRRGFYLWMLIAPLTAPFTIIPIIPNLPFFFCVWRSWSHYKAYMSSQYLSSLLDCGLIEPNPSFELDQLYASFTSTSGTSQNLPSSILASRSSEKTSTVENVAADRKLEAACGMEASSRSECIIPTNGAMRQILEMCHLPESAAADMYRAMKQAHVRLTKSP